MNSTCEFTVKAPYLLYCICLIFGYIIEVPMIEPTLGLVS